MSGGVDSSVAAALLQGKGWEVIGVHFKLFEPDALATPAVPASQAVQVVAEQLQVPLHMVEKQQEFQSSIIDYFVHEYACGRTPNPCVFCNRLIKFSILLEKARESGADAIATGHYANVIFDESRARYLLKKGKSKSKEQSYFLFRLTQEQLAKAVFPVGNMSKEAVRKEARRLGLPNADRDDSQEVCFIPENDYKAYILKKDPDVFRSGKIVDMSGKKLGEHHGTAFYTIGQRKGLGIAHTEPLYVVRIDQANNQLIVGAEKELYRQELTADQLNWIGLENMVEPIKAGVKIRYKHDPAEATITPLENGRVKVVFTQPQRAITPGQAVVFYHEDIVLGGGIIL